MAEELERRTDVGEPKLDSLIDLASAEEEKRDGEGRDEVIS
jgi:hypothetical protein